MSSNSQNLLEFTRTQQTKLIQKLKSEGPTNTTVKSSASEPSIIKIIPNNYNKIMGKIKVQNPRTIKQLPSASTSSETCIIDDSENCFIAVEDNENFENYDETDPIEIETNQTPDQNRPKLHINILKREPTRSTVASVPSKKRKMMHSSQCCSCCREKLETILEQQQEILNLLKNTQYESKPALPATIHVEKLDLLPPMPFNNINDFLDFDESLTNENVQYQFIVKLNKLLVNTEQKSVSNVMSAIMTNELCKSISWIGVKDTIPFGTSNMVGMIVDLIQEHHQINIDTVKSKIAEWLRRCGDRISNEMRRKQKKSAQSYKIINLPESEITV